MIMNDQIKSRNLICKRNPLCFRNICLHREKTFVFVSHITQSSPALPSLRRKEIEIKI